MLTCNGSKTFQAFIKSVTIHVYGKRLEKFNVYVPTKKKNVYTCETKYIHYNS